MELLKNKTENLKIKTKGLKAEEIIRLASQEFGAKINFATSLGEEDQVITDMISKVAPQIEIFTLDTGRLHQETYDLWAKNQKKYRLNFKIMFPDAKKVED